MSSFLMQFYENKSVPKLIIINTDIKDKKLIEETLSKKESHTISINTAKKGTKAKVIAMAEKNAKESLNRKLYEQIIIKIYLKVLLKNLILKIY